MNDLLTKVGSINDIYTRFVSLTLEQQAWVQKYLSDDIYIPATEENVLMARSIAKVLPIRMRWAKIDRFGKYYTRCEINVATHFKVKCRQEEDARKRQRRKKSPLLAAVYRALNQTGKT